MGINQKIHTIVFILAYLLGAVAVGICQNSNNSAITRQLPEGYVLSSMIYYHDIYEFKTRGIEVILSAVMPEMDVRMAISANDIEWFYIPMGTSLNHISEIVYVLNTYPPESILIHCEHGADRTGVIAVFILATHHNWPIDKALFAVLSPTAQNIRNLLNILRDNNIYTIIENGDPLIGLYSSGGPTSTAGLKTASDGYRNLIQTTIDAIQAWRKE